MDDLTVTSEPKDHGQWLDILERLSDLAKKDGMRLVMILHHDDPYADDYKTGYTNSAGCTLAIGMCEWAKVRIKVTGEAYEN